MWRKAPCLVPWAASINGIIYRRMDRLLKDSKLCHENGFPNPLVQAWPVSLRRTLLSPLRDWGGLCSLRDWTLPPLVRAYPRTSKGCAPCHLCQPAFWAHSREAEGLTGGTVSSSSPTGCLPALAALHAMRMNFLPEHTPSLFILPCIAGSHMSHMSRCLLYIYWGSKDPLCFPSDFPT